MDKGRERIGTKMVLGGSPIEYEHQAEFSENATVK